MTPPLCPREILGPGSRFAERTSSGFEKRSSPGACGLARIGWFFATVSSAKSSPNFSDLAPQSTAPFSHHPPQITWSPTTKRQPPHFSLPGERPQASSIFFRRKILAQVTGQTQRRGNRRRAPAAGRGTVPRRGLSIFFQLIWRWSAISQIVRRSRSIAPAPSEVIAAKQAGRPPPTLRLSATPRVSATRAGRVCH